MNTLNKTTFIKNSITATIMSCSLLALSAVHAGEERGAQYDTGSGTAAVDKSIKTEPAVNTPDHQGSQYESPNGIADLRFEDMDANQDGAIDSAEFSSFQETQTSAKPAGSSIKGQDYEAKE